MKRAGFYLIVLLGLVEHGVAIMCYECNSALNSMCSAPVLPDSLKKNCSDLDRGVTHTLCRKIIQHVDYETNGQMPMSRVIRSCGWDESRILSQMQEYGGDKTNEHRDIAEGRERTQEGFHGKHQYPVTQKNYGLKEGEVKVTYGRVASGVYESTSSQQYHNTRNNNSSLPTFSSPPHSPLVGVVFNPSSPNYSRSTMTEHTNSDRRSQSSWSVSNQEPIGTGARKKIVKSHEKRNFSSADPRFHERYKDSSTEIESRKLDRNLRADSTTSLDFFAEGERMVSELCNIPDPNAKSDPKNSKTYQQDEDKNKSSGSSDILLTALDKLIIHDQIPLQIVQLAIEACTDAENIAIAHHNRPCFKNIHSICAKTRSNVQKPDSAVANLHSQGIPWVIKNFIFSFVRILDGWKGVKELLSEKHDTFSRIENKYYSPNIRECFVQWQAITKEMLTHIYKTFKCLDQGFTMEQKSFTHNYYATNSAAPRHQNQGKFQPIKAHVSTPRAINSSPQPYNTVQPPWMQNQSQPQVQSFNEAPWPSRPNVNYKKFPVVPPPNTQNVYPLNDQNEIDYQKAQYKCDPYNVREAKPRQSWTITNVPDFRALESMCHSDQRELYNQLRHKMDAELGKAPGQPLFGAMPCDLMQRRDMELKAKMIPLSHVEKTLIPSMATVADIKNYVQKNNSCGDTKEDSDFFAAWGQMVQKESNDFLTHHTHNIQIPSNVVTLSSNISGPVQFIDNENDEFHEMSKVYMKPGSYKVPIKPADPLSPFAPSGSPEMVFDNQDDVNSLKINSSYSSVTLAPQPKYNFESWPCLISRRAEEVFSEEQKLRNMLPSLEMRNVDCLDILSTMTSDRAWEAAKQSAPKLMDFLHEGCKSDTARLYGALGLCSIGEYASESKEMQSNLDRSEVWPTSSTLQQYMKLASPLWDQNTNKPDLNCSFFNEDISKLCDSEQKSIETEENIDLNVEKIDGFNEMKRPNFDQTGNYVKDESQKRTATKTKVAVSGMWYHPKKKKTLPPNTVKKFEIILAKLSTLNEAKFIQHDMDIKTAPRFYEIVKYPMCLHDILTKLKNSSYTELDQVIQDFRRIFNNVKLYLKSYPDSTMKKSISKVALEFENLLNEEFPIKMETRKQDDQHDSNRKCDKESN
ncbi:unnamed protein product [Leptosia nina]|uniref:Bromo domain-containing protein n=1 Tax=Leptosia nina TaxID=320188 RepID=A0AAV1K581_9NEOP